MRTHSRAQVLAAVEVAEAAEVERQLAALQANGPADP
jgi:hypothetical protein